MNFVTSQSVRYIASRDTGVLCDEVGHLTPFFSTNKSNKVEGTVTNVKSRYFERLTKYERFKYLLKQVIDPAYLTFFGKWFHELGPPTAKEHCVCVFVRVCARTGARVCVCV